MKIYMKNSVSVIALSALLLGGIAVASVLITAEPAFSNSHKSNNGNNGNGNGGNNGNRGNGASASALGALNAAHANPNAFLHASDNSRIGRIRTYMEAVQASDEAQLTYVDILEALTEFDDFESGFDTYEDFLAAFDADPTDLDDEASFWDAVLAVLESEITLGDLEAAEGDALALAANKEITEQVIEDLWSLLEDVDLTPDE